MGASLTPITTPWADTGSKVDPEVSEAGKTAEGWLPNEQPAMEWENYIANQRDEKINEIMGYLNAGVPLEDLIDGAMDITSGDFTLKMSPTGGIELLHSDGSLTKIQAGQTPGSYAVRHLNATTGIESILGPDGVGVIAKAGATYQPRNLNTGKGISWLSGPGTPMNNVRPMTFDASTLVWSSSGSGWISTTGLVLTGLPFATATLRVISGSIRWRNTVTNTHFCVPVEIRLDDSSGTANLQAAVVAAGTQPDAANTTGHQISLRFDATDVD